MSLGITVHGLNEKLAYLETQHEEAIQRENKDKIKQAKAELEKKDKVAATATI